MVVHKNWLPCADDFLTLDRTSFLARLLRDLCRCGRSNLYPSLRNCRPSLWPPHKPKRQTDLRSVLFSSTEALRISARPKIELASKGAIRTSLIPYKVHFRCGHNGHGGVHIPFGASMTSMSSIAMARHTPKCWYFSQNSILFSTLVVMASWPNNPPISSFRALFSVVSCNGDQLVSGHYLPLFVHPLLSSIVLEDK